MLKRITTLLLLIAITITSLVGCSSPESSEPDTPIEFTLSQYSDTETEVEINKYDTVTFYLEPFVSSEEDLEIINSNDEVAKCTFKSVHAVAGEKLAIINIKGISEGTTTMYLKDKNSTSQSQSITITVIKVEEEVDNSRTVYTNLNGDKYHYSKTCAGKSAQTTTLNKVIRYKEPCSKCVN